MKESITPKQEIKPSSDELFEQFSALDDEISALQYKAGELHQAHPGDTEVDIKIETELNPLINQKIAESSALFAAYKEALENEQDQYRQDADVHKEAQKFGNN